MKKIKKSILVDLDGVLNLYNGKYIKTSIPNPKDGARDFLERLSLKYKVYIFSSRPVFMVAKWLIKHDLDKYIEDVTNVKIPAFLYIDDRAVCFRGDFEQAIEEIEKFSPYWKFSN